MNKKLYTRNLEWLYPTEEIPQISIVIPVFNEEKLLPRLLSSLLRVENPGVVCELLFIDNGSTDKSIQILNDAGVKVITEKQPGLRFARVCGIREARGTIIVQTDADSCLPKDLLTSYKKIFYTKPDVALVYAPVVHDSIHFLISWYIILARIKACIKNSPFPGHLYGGPNMAYRKDVAIENLGTYCAYKYVDEDMHMGRIVRSSGFKILHTDYPSVIASGRKFQGLNRAMNFLQERFKVKVMGLFRPTSITPRFLENIR